MRCYRALTLFIRKSHFLSIFSSPTDKQQMPIVLVVSYLFVYRDKCKHSLDSTLWPSHKYRRRMRGKKSWPDFCQDLFLSLVVPKWVISEIQKICFEFIWKGKYRIKRLILYQGYNEGGLRMTNFDSFVKTQRVMWVKRLLYREKSLRWKLLWFLLQDGRR